MAETTSQKGWYSRGYLPHYDGAGATQFVTYRLFDSVPVKLLKAWEAELKFLQKHEREKEEALRTNLFIDKGSGECWLRQPEIARLVEEAFLHYHDSRYTLQAWVVMPNHVHVLFRMSEEHLLPKVIDGLKTYTARTANKILNRRGHFWYRDYFDRYIRNEEHYWNTIHYIERNPVKAALCRAPSDWEFSSARFRAEDGSLDWARIRRPEGGGPS